MAGLAPEPVDRAIARVLAGGFDAPAETAFLAQRFPPPESVDMGHGWLVTPLAAITEDLGTCGATDCHQPTAYVATADGSFLTACAEHACKLATVINEHARCPACHVKWTYSEQAA